MKLFLIVVYIIVMFLSYGENCFLSIDMTTCDQKSDELLTCTEINQVMYKLQKIQIKKIQYNLEKKKNRQCIYFKKNLKKKMYIRIIKDF